MAEATHRWGRWRVVVYLLLGLVAVDWVVGAYRKVWRTYDPDEYRVRPHNCKQRPHDLVVIGGSPGAEGIDPTILAGLPWNGKPLRDAFNLSLCGATTAEIRHAVEHSLPVPPKVLVYGITATDLNDARREPHGPESLLKRDDVIRWARERPETAEWCVRHYLMDRIARLWNLYYYRNGIRLWAADQVERLWPGLFAETAAEARKGLCTHAAMSQDHGFSPNPKFQGRRIDQIDAVGHIRALFRHLRSYRLGAYLRDLHAIIDWAHERNVELVLVDMPVSRLLEEQEYPKEFALYRKALAQVESERGVRVLRASRAAVGLTDADFADWIHLNASGTPRLTHWLREQLAAVEPTPEKERP